MSTEVELRSTWRNLLTRYNVIACRLDREMQGMHDLTMSDFETLDRLMDLGCEHCRMQELGADMYLSSSALSRSVARLESKGLVVRSLCHDDRRGVFVDVTDAGREVHAAARATHNAVLAELMTADDVVACGIR